MPSSAKTGNANIAAATDKKSFFHVFELLKGCFVNIEL